MVPVGEHQTREGGPNFSPTMVSRFGFPFGFGKRGGFWGGPPFFLGKNRSFLFSFGVGGWGVWGFSPSSIP